MAILTIEEIVKHSTIYNLKHRVTDDDVKTANYYQKKISSRSKIPTSGDIIICIGPAKKYAKGHLAKLPPSFSNVCVQPYIPFVFTFKGKLLFESSGGYWLTVKSIDEFKYIEKRKKIFKTWGHCGACADGAFYFPATVNVWEYYSEEIY